MFKTSGDQVIQAVTQKKWDKAKGPKKCYYSTKETRKSHCNFSIKEWKRPEAFWVTW
jgi:hypothetical protein